LQLANPDLCQSLEKLAKAGCRRIIIIPFFLFVGNHVSRDIPEIIEREKKRYPDIRFIYAENLGADSRIADIVADKIKENMHEAN
ncbi:cobalamin biosynthesis protein CbiX, partial [bacterium]